MSQMRYRYTNFKWILFYFLNRTQRSIHGWQGCIIHIYAHRKKGAAVSIEHKALRSRNLCNISSWIRDINSYTNARAPSCDSGIILNVDWLLELKLTYIFASFLITIYVQEDVTKEQKERAIKDYPGLLEMFGFSYLYCGFLVGPQVMQ